jgi:hypothetical protein
MMVQLTSDAGGFWGVAAFSGFARKLKQSAQFQLRGGIWAGVKIDPGFSVS